MKYAPGNDKVVEKARKPAVDQWNTLPVESIPYGTVLQANEETLKTTNRPKAFRGEHLGNPGSMDGGHHDPQPRL